jgi:hypothetical protein
MIYKEQVFPYCFHLVHGFLTSGARNPAGVEREFRGCECGESKINNALGQVNWVSSAAGDTETDSDITCAVFPLS